MAVHGESPVSWRRLHRWQEYLLTAFDMSMSSGVVAQARAPPRQIAATISYWIR